MEVLPGVIVIEFMVMEPQLLFRIKNGLPLIEQILNLKIISMSVGHSLINMEVKIQMTAV